MMAEGAPPRDLSAYTGWRETADPVALSLLDAYAIFLSGQLSPDSRALRVEAIVTTLQLLGWNRRDIPDAIITLNVIHSVVLERARREAERGR